MTPSTTLVIGLVSGAACGFALAIPLFAVVSAARQKQADDDLGRALEARDWWQRQAQAATTELLTVGVRLQPVPVAPYDGSEPPMSVDDADRLAVDAMKEKQRAMA